MTEDYHHLRTCTLEELAEVVRCRARIAARSHRLQLDSASADDNALQRARAACQDRGEGRMAELVIADAREADRKEALALKAMTEASRERPSQAS